MDIAHAGSIVTRYCHMLTHPYVHEGQAVVVGQIIGIVGSSGSGIEAKLIVAGMTATQFSIADPTDI